MSGRMNKKNGCCLRNRVRNCFRRSNCDDTISKLSKRGRNGRVKVCKVTGDRKVCARMASMGLYPGAEADVICAGTSNQCVLRINGGTISLDADISDNVYVMNL